MTQASSRPELAVGVLGGMGPQATVDFLAKLVEATPVASEQEHLRVLVDSNAKVVDRNQAIAGTGPSPGPQLAAMARGLEEAGAGFLVMACNTAHAFEADIRHAVKIPFVSMVEEAADACAREHAGARRVGVLAAPGCIASGLYQNALRKRGLEPLLLQPAQQQRFNELLYLIKLKTPLADIAPDMKALGQALVDAGAEVLLAGCTEVPLVLGPQDLPRPLLDATWILAQRCVRYARHPELLAPPDNRFTPKKA